MAIRKSKSKKGKPNSRIHLLDVGEAQYGDCILCEIGKEWILIDGGHEADFNGDADHPSIPDQIRRLAGTAKGEATHLSLLIISHAHADHIGCVPNMVAQGIITAEWAFLVDPDLAWDPDESESDSPANRLLATLREEPRADIVSNDAYDAFARDVKDLQPKYRQMIRKLKADGTKVVLHGKSALGALEARFADIGLKVLGPSKAHLLACADLIHSAGRDFIHDAAQAIATDGNPAALYRQLQALWAKEIEPADEELVGALDETDASEETGSTDAVRNLGPVINLQSSAIVLGDGQHRFLFTGDSQLEKPEVADDAITKSIAEIYQRIEQYAPYDFVKLGHHGSYNAFGTRLLSSIGDETKNFGICTGANSLHHPSKQAIQLLKDRGAGAKWARTDKNGEVTFAFDAGKLTVTKRRGRLNDTSVPSPDEVSGPGAGQPALPVAPPAQARAVTPASATITPVSALSPTTPIEISIPYIAGTSVEIALTLKIQAAAPAAAVVAPQLTKPLARSDEPIEFSLAGGRTLPPLLFLTQSERLLENVGIHAFGTVLTSLRTAGQTIVEVASTPPDKLLAVASAASQEALRAHPEIQGVVILGGYDVIPAERRDAAPGASEATRSNDQEDRYIVWSDSLYADHDQDGLAELPVSRIPDGKSAALLLAALSAPAHPQLIDRHGVRNAFRPFADKIFTNMTGPAPMLQSHPHPQGVPSYTVSGDHVYLMLHGDYADSTRFWGELDDHEAVEALHIDQIRLAAGTIVFTGCCWGALPVLELAGASVTDSPTPRTPQDSIALRCLLQGARAFVGCTGMHYSPAGLSIGSASGPLHDGFWRRVRTGLAPAKALFEARNEFIANPARARSNQDRKIFEQFTVLGLGW